jgi:tetratricopeptide (TPR) repeat protein
MFREDHIIRLIQQLVDAIARIAGLNRRGDHDQALAEAEQAWGKLLDAPADLRDAVDTATLAEMLRYPEKMRVAARLLHEEGHALAGKGDPLHAAVRHRRAMELLLEARAIEPSDDAMVMELSRLVPVATLDPRYRSRV